MPHWRPAFLALLAFGASGCGADDDISVSLTAHALAGCRPLPRGARLELGALGEFPESSRSRVSIPIDEPANLSIPAETLAIEASATFAGDRFLGFSEREGGRDVPLLLWAEDERCVLGGNERYPVTGGGQAVGYSATTRTLLVAGGRADTAPSASVALLAFDAGTGEARLVEDAAEATLAEARAFATVTPFGDRLLVAGGENPLHGSSEERATPRNTAEIFDPASGTVDPTPIVLQEERTQHAATVLPNGDTLLVGGRGVFGDPLLVLEAVSPESRRSSIAGLAALAAARLSPTVLRLDDGRLFVSGGTAADGTPLSVLEWLAPDASERLAATFPPELPARLDRAFAALPGGGVLMVGGCEARAPLDQSDPDACERDCARGCPPNPRPVEDDDEPDDEPDYTYDYDSWWVDAEGTLTRIAVGFEPVRPVLLGGADGRPWLVSGPANARRIHRFNPWQGNFQTTDLTLGGLPSDELPRTALDAQAFAWLAEDEPGIAFLAGARFGTRSRYARDLSLITRVDPEDPSRPLDLVPDRMIDDQVSYDGTLHFAANADVTVLVAGTDYADVAIELELDPGAPPRVVLGSDEMGGIACPWPDGQGTRLTLRRMDERVVLERDGLSTSCAGPAGRVRVGLRGGTAESHVRRLDLRRGG